MAPDIGETGSLGAVFSQCRLAIHSHKGATPTAVPTFLTMQGLMFKHHAPIKFPSYASQWGLNISTATLEDAIKPCQNQGRLIAETSLVPELQRL